MATANHCLASLTRLSITAPARPIIQTTKPRFLAPAAIAQQSRHAATGRAPIKKDKGKEGPKKRQFKGYRVDRLDKMQQFSLCDAMRYIRAFEVGEDPTTAKYDLAIKLKTLKSGPVIRSRIALPYTVRSDRRIGVICKENSAVAIQALAAGAVAVGEESLFEIFRSGTIKFTSVICAQSSADKFAKTKDLPRILGPKGLMPSLKTRTITNNVLGMLREMAGADIFREKDGVVRIAIGQLGFTPDMLAANVKAFVNQLKEECLKLEGQVSKEVHEVVLGATHSPGFSLNGGFNPTEEGLTPAMLTGRM